jgi:hypothetical protein
MSSTVFDTSPAMHILRNSVDSRRLETHQYSQWQQWSLGNGRRQSRHDLMSDMVDARHERHMYIPSRSNLQNLPPQNASLDDDEMVMRVVQFFQNIHTMAVMRQLQIEEGEPYQPYQCSAPPVATQQQCWYLENNEVDGSATAFHDDSCHDEMIAIVCTELGQSASCLLAEQEALWNRLKHQQEQQQEDQQQQPLIPEWLHEAARQQGQRIRVVQLEGHSETQLVTCIGCKVQMLALAHAQIVYCPRCGCTFALAVLAAECG